MRGVNDDEIGDFVEMTRHQPVNVRFIEYMPFDGNIWSTSKMVPFKEMMARVNERWVGWYAVWGRVFFWLMQACAGHLRARHLPHVVVLNNI